MNISHRLGSTAPQRTTKRPKRSKKTIEDSKSSSEAVKTATQELGELSKAIKLEADTENLINAKIGSPCVVVIGSNTAQVVVGKRGIEGCHYRAD